MAIIAVVFVAVIGFDFLRTRLGSGPSNPNAPATQSDATIKAAMIENINALPDSTSVIPRDASGVPDIAVRDGVLIVSTSAPSSAASLCRLVAAITNSSDTAAPLGVIGVIVISGGQDVATCRP